MGFYEAISKYYDDIFPVGKEQVQFIMANAGAPPKAVLDVACGTGGYALALAQQGYTVTAVDLDEKMIEGLKEKIMATGVDIHGFQANMLALTQKLDKKYDLAFCIGNSLVHLEDDKEIKGFLKEMRSLLVEDGKLVIQIINYDRVLKHNVQSLPTIDNREIGLKFERLYRYEQSSHKIWFKTILQVEGKKLENEIPLHPLQSDTMGKLLRDSGFQDFDFYGDFKGSPFDRDHSYSFVVVAS